MGDKVLSDILLFKQLDEASKQPITRDETNNTNNNYINNINTNNNNNNSILEVKKKKVIIVKKNVVNDSPMLPEIVDTTITATPTKKVVVARKVKLGDSFLPPLTKSENTNSNINNNNNNNINNGNNVIGNVSQSISSHDGTIPLSIISRGKRGPKYDAENRILERSLLGSPDDYLAWKPTGVTVVAPVAVTRPPSPPPSLSPSPSLSLSSTSRPRTAADADDLIGLMKTMSFHEKVRYLKEENALHRWERTVAEWERMKKAMASRTGRDVDQVLLTRSEAFRTVMEHKELIERALATRDHAVSDLFSSPLLPMDSGLFLPLRPPSREPMEMIGRPKAQRSRPTSSYYSARKLELQDSVNMLAPYEPDLDGLSIVGTPISRMIEPPNFSSLSNFPTLAGISSLEAANPSIASLSTYVHPPSTYDGWTDFSPMSTPSAQRYRGPKVLFEGAHQTQMQEMQETQETQELRVVCEVAVGGLARAELHAHNVGSTAIYYRWRKVDRERVFQVKEETDTTQRFYFHDVQGVMLPSETHTFIFGFKSDNHGIFFEKWVFESSPTLSTPGPTLTLKGIAIQEDDTAEARYQLEEAIGAKQINHGVQDIIRSMIDCIKPVVKPIPPLEDLDMEQEFFLRQNRDLHLYYSTENCKAFQSLARSTFETLMFSEDKKWNFSVLSLHEDIQCIHDERQRSDLLSDLNCLIEQASMPNHCTTTLPYLSSNTSSVGDKTVFYCLAYDLLVQLADRVPSLSSSIRESFSLPPVAFVPAEDDFLRKVDSYGNILDLSKQKMKDLSKRKGGSRRKLAESPDKRQESPPRKKKDKSKEKDEDSDKAEDERHKSPVRKRLSRGRTRERDKADAPKEKEKEEKPHSIKESMAVSTRRLKKKKPEEEEKKEEEEEEWSVERKAKEGDYKNELFSQVHELVIETFVRYRQLAQEAEAVARRVSQDLFFQTIAASSPNPMDRFLEGELMAMEEREEREEEMDDAQSTVSYSYPKNTPRESANFSNINSNINAKNNSNSNLNELAESEYPLDARARRRRRVLNRK